MAQSHHCPCCHATIWRREVKTCGSPQCLTEWRQMPLSARAKMIELAEGNDFESPPTTLDTPTEMDPPLKKALFPEQLDPQEELDKIFGKKGDDKL